MHFKKLVELVGCVSLFVVPSFHGFQLVHIALLLCVLLFLVADINGHEIRIKNQSSDFTLLGFAVLFFSGSIVGAVNSYSYAGIITSCIFLLCFLFAFFCAKHNLLPYFFYGFYCSGIISGLFIIFDWFQFTYTVTPLSALILPESMLGKAGEHTLDNYCHILGNLVYRPCGLSWDPGLNVTGMTLSYIVAKEGFTGHYCKKLGRIIIISAIFLAISKTSIIVLTAYWLIKALKIQHYRTRYGKRVVIFYLIPILLCSLFLLGQLIQYNPNSENAGNIRHLKYFSSLCYCFLSNPVDFLFGYGFTNPGHFFEKYVPWIQSGDFTLAGTAAESTLTNIFLIGGFVGSTYWISAVILILKSNNSKLITTLFCVILLSFGFIPCFHHWHCILQCLIKFN